MRKARFTESQMVGILKEGEARVPIADLVRKRGISRSCVTLRSGMVRTAAPSSIVCLLRPMRTKSTHRYGNTSRTDTPTPS